MNANKVRRRHILVLDWLNGGNNKQYKKAALWSTQLVLGSVNGMASTASEEKGEAWKARRQKYRPVLQCRCKHTDRHSRRRVAGDCWGFRTAVSRQCKCRVDDRNWRTDVGELLRCFNWLLLLMSTAQYCYTCTVGNDSGKRRRWMEKTSRQTRDTADGGSYMDQCRWQRWTPECQSNQDLNVHSL